MPTNILEISVMFIVPFAVGAAIRALLRKTCIGFVETVVFAVAAFMLGVVIAPNAPRNSEVYLSLASRFLFAAIGSAVAATVIKAIGVSKSKETDE